MSYIYSALAIPFYVLGLALSEIAAGCCLIAEWIETGRFQFRRYFPLLLVASVCSVINAGEPADPKMAEGLVTAAVTLAKTDPVQARSMLHLALEKDGSNARAHLELAKLARNSKDGAEKSQALTHACRAFRLASAMPDNPVGKESAVIIRELSPAASQLISALQAYTDEMRKLAAKGDAQELDARTQVLSELGIAFELENPMDLAIKKAPPVPPAVPVRAMPVAETLRTSPVSGKLYIAVSAITPQSVVGAWRNENGRFISVFPDNRHTNDTGDYIGKVYDWSISGENFMMGWASGKKAYKLTAHGTLEGLNSTEKYEKVSSDPAARREPSLNAAPVNPAPAPHR